MKTSLGAVVYLNNSMIKLINYEIFFQLITEIFGRTVKCYADVVLPKLSKNAGKNELAKRFPAVR